MYESPSITTSDGFTCPFWHVGGGVMTGSVEAPSGLMTEGVIASREPGALASSPGWGPSLPELDPPDLEEDAPAPPEPDEDDAGLFIELSPPFSVPAGCPVESEPLPQAAIVARMPRPATNRPGLP
jgi:hypothetical protein